MTEVSSSSVESSAESIEIQRTHLREEGERIERAHAGLDEEGGQEDCRRVESAQKQFELVRKFE